MIIRPPQRGQGHGYRRCSSELASSSVNGGDAQELAEASDVGGTVAIGKQPTVADAAEALGEDLCAD
jgi:hypothetical protein